MVRWVNWSDPGAIFTTEGLQDFSGLRRLQPADRVGNDRTVEPFQVQHLLGPRVASERMLNDNRNVRS